MNFVSLSKVRDISQGMCFSFLLSNSAVEDSLVLLSLTPRLNDERKIDHCSLFVSPKDDLVSGLDFLD